MQHTGDMLVSDNSSCPASEMSTGCRFLAYDVNHMAAGYALFCMAQTIGLCSACAQEHCAAICWFMVCSWQPHLKERDCTLQCCKPVLPLDCFVRHMRCTAGCMRSVKLPPPECWAMDPAIWSLSPSQAQCALSSSDSMAVLHIVLQHERWLRPLNTYITVQHTRGIACAVLCRAVPCCAVLCRAMLCYH